MSDQSPLEPDEAPPSCYRHPGRPTYITCQRCARPVCPECQTPAAVGVQCPECIREGRESAPRTRWTANLRPGGRTVVTYSIIGVNVVMYALQWLLGPQFTTALFLWPYTVGSEPWRLLTSAFLHSTSTIVVHLLLNMYAVFLFGPILESFLGRARFLALYLIGALGASGAVFALMGALFALRRPLGLDLRQLAIVLALNLALPFFIPNIAWTAHLGGLVVGFALGLIMLRTRRREDRTRQVLGMAGVAALLIALFLAYVLSAPGIYL